MAERVDRRGGRASAGDRVERARGNRVGTRARRRTDRRSGHRSTARPPPGASGCANADSPGSSSCTPICRWPPSLDGIADDGDAPVAVTRSRSPRRRQPGALDPRGRRLLVRLRTRLVRASRRRSAPARPRGSHRRRPRARVRCRRRVGSRCPRPRARAGAAKSSHDDALRSARARSGCSRSAPTPTTSSSGAAPRSRSGPTPAPKCTCVSAPTARRERGTPARISPRWSPAVKTSNAMPRRCSASSTCDFSAGSTASSKTTSRREPRCAPRSAR